MDLLLLNNTVLKITNFSSNGIFFFAPLLLLIRLLFSTYNMESTQSIFESLKGLVSVIFFVFIFKYFFPELVEISFSLIKLPTLNFEIRSIYEMLGSIYVIFLMYLTAILQSINYLLIFSCLFMFSISFPVSYMLDRLYNYSYFWTLNKIIISAVFSWLIVMYFIGFTLTDDYNSTLIDAITVSSGFTKNLLALAAFCGSIFLNVTKSETGNSLDSLANQLLAQHSPDLFDKKVMSGLSSGKYRIDESGRATDRFSLDIANKNSAKSFRDKALSDFIEKNSLKSVSEAEQRLNSPESFSAIDKNLESHKNKMAEIVKSNGLTNLGDAELLVSNNAAFSSIQTNKTKERLMLDEQMSKSITEGKASSISEAKNLIQFEKSSSAISDLNSKRSSAIHSALENKGFESLGEANLYIEDRKSFDLLKANKNNASILNDSQINDLIESGAVNSIPEAKQAILYPASFGSQQNSQKNLKVNLDNTLAGVISKNPVYSIGEARDFVEMPNSWSAVKLKSNQVRTRI